MSHDPQSPSDAADFDDDYIDDEEADCGMMDDGICQLAGSEYCDFDCPFRA